jgi:hypothetical protein
MLLKGWLRLTIKALSIQIATPDPENLESHNPQPIALGGVVSTSVIPEL